MCVICIHIDRERGRESERTSVISYLHQIFVFVLKSILVISNYYLVHPEICHLYLNRASRRSAVKREDKVEAATPPSDRERCGRDIDADEEWRRRKIPAIAVKVFDSLLTQVDNDRQV
tara:strand:- start:1509 stop:1862 length:354 start_codon:yes stop_codon:yes gene_type:complete